MLLASLSIGSKKVKLKWAKRLKTTETLKPNLDKGRILKEVPLMNCNNTRKIKKLSARIAENWEKIGVRWKVPKNYREILILSSLYIWTAARCSVGIGYPSIVANKLKKRRKIHIINELLLRLPDYLEVDDYYFRPSQRKPCNFCNNHPLHIEDIVCNPSSMRVLFSFVKCPSFFT